MEHIRKALEQAEKDRLEARKRVESGGVAPQVTEIPSDPAAETDRFRVPTEVQYQRTRVVDVPEEVFERNRLVAALSRHPLTDSYSMLRTRVLQQLTANNWNALAVTSPATGHGKTLTAINLAISLAREVNHTVLLADLDLRSPSVHSYFEYEPAAGLADFLQNDVPLSDILFSPGIDRLVVLPGRESIGNSSETLSSPKMVNLVAELKGRYPDRLVICDLPPILATDDALTFAPYSHALLMVTEAGSTRREDLEQSLEILRDVPLIGTVLNKAEPLSGRHYSRYGRG